MIDFHTHCYPPELAPRALAMTSLYGRYETDGTAEGQIKLMEQIGMDKCVVLHIANRPDEQHNVNKFAVSINGKGDKLISFGAIHPHAGDALQELDWLYAHGIRGIKFQPIRQMFNMDEDICRPVFRRIGELGLPVVVHSGGSARTRDFRVTPRAIRKCIDLFRGNLFICSHMGGMFCTERELDEFAAMPIHTDTAVSVRHLDQRAFNLAAERFGPDRIFFGTDMPWALMAKEMAYVENSPFSQAEKQAIFEGNARRAIARYHLA